jgi:hypothetical protein
MPVTNTAMFSDNKATIEIIYNHKIGDLSKYIDVAYYLVHENVESGQISQLQVESPESLDDICTKVHLQITYGTLDPLLCLQNEGKY